VEDAEIIEVSTPQLEDVIRLEDRYGRVPGVDPEGDQRSAAQS